MTTTLWRRFGKAIDAQRTNNMANTMEQSDKERTIFLIEMRDNILSQMDKIRTIPNQQPLWDGYREILNRCLCSIYNKGYQKGFEEGQRAAFYGDFGELNS